MFGLRSVCARVFQSSSVVLTWYFALYNSGHAIDAKEGISLLHYKQTDPAEPYKNTLNLVPCFTKNTDFPLFRDCGAEVMARSIANLLSRAFGLEDVFCQSESLQAALDHEAAAIAAATATVGDSASRGAPSVRRRSSYAVLPQRAATSGSGAIVDAAEEWRTTHRHSTFIKMQMKPLELVVVPKLLLGEIPVRCGALWSACLSVKQVKIRRCVVGLGERTVGCFGRHNSRTAEPITERPGAHGDN
mgnify:CR=1 FL=1